MRPLLVFLLVPTIARASARAVQDSAPASAPAEDPAALRARGEAALAAGRIDEALDLFRAARDRDGGSLASRLAIGRALLADRRFNDALDELDDARKLAPEDPDVAVLFGRVFLAKGETMAAQRASGARILPFEEDSLRAMFGLARTRLESVLAKNPKHAEAAVLLARAHLAVGDLEGAATALERAAAADAGFPGVARLRGDLAWERARAAKQAGKPEEERARLAKAAREAYEDAAKADPGDAVSRRALGDLLFQEGKKEEAASAYAESLAIDPAALDLGATVRAFSAATARRLFDQAAEKADARLGAEAPESATLWWYAGFCAFHAEDWKRAREAFGKCLVKNPSISNAHYYAAKSAYSEKDYAAAGASFVALARAGFEAFAKTVKEAGNAEHDQEILFFLADRAVREDRDADARDLFRALAELAPDNADHWNNAAFFARQSGADEASYDYYRKALEIRPDDPQLLNAAAVILHYNLHRDVEEAKRLYRRAIECADRILKNKDASEAAKAEAETAKFDAGNNLRLLGEKVGERRAP